MKKLKFVPRPQSSANSTTGIRHIIKQNFYSTDNYKPEKRYSNSDLDKIQILSDNKNKSGVYCFTNRTNGQKYVGSSTNLRKRFLDYFNTNN
jgi:excinuclease UvrABC nuclease subunit